ncbi:MAG: PIG-L family deacetylase [Candidatus Bathyarchaeota archaeon]|nr:PIG-L family deacetylase [Candidatus Bathyarchaeota archaeon]
MHLVFIGAHPDDEAFASGTIAKYVDRGHKATIVHATRGGRGHWEIPSEDLKEIRTMEMSKAAEILGADVRFLDYEDASVPDGDTLREALVDVIRELKPDIVITFHPLVWRDDHRRVGLAASDASMKASLPLHVTAHPAHRPEPEVYFFGSTMSDAKPDVYVDVSDYMDVKVESFRQHVSQWQRWGEPPERQEGYLEEVVTRYIHRFRQLGREAGVDYAEAFISKTGRKYAHDLLPARR